MPTLADGAGLLGVGYRDKEIQDSRSNGFDTLNPTGISHASIGGGLNIFIKGQGFESDFNKIHIFLDSTELGRPYLAPFFSLEDTIQSSPEEGLLSYRLPDLTTLLGLNDAELLSKYSSWTFELKIRKSPGDTAT